MAWLTTDLLADVRRRAMLPTTTALGTADSDILEHANNEMATRLAPLVMSVNEEFYVQTIDVTLTSGVSAYRLPNRNAGAKLRDVTLVRGNTVLNLARIEPERLTDWTTTAAGVPQGFYLEAGTVNLVPAPSGGGTLRLKYFVRPGRFTATATDYGVITGATYNGNAVALTFTGSLLTVNAQLYDVIAYRPPFEYLVTDGVASGSSAGNSTLTVSSPTTPAPNLSPNIAVGDYICARDKSPIIQLPVELQSLLVQRTVCAIMESFGYDERLARAEEAYERMEAAALKLLSPRVDGAPKKMRGLLSAVTRFGPGLR